MRSGKIIQKSKERVGSNVLIQNGIAYAVLLCDDANIQSLGAFDLSTDKIKWICDPQAFDEEMNYKGDPWRILGSRLYASGLGFRALDLEEGEIIWSIRSSSNDSYTPVGTQENELYVFYEKNLWIIDELHATA